MRSRVPALALAAAALWICGGCRRTAPAAVAGAAGTPQRIVSTAPSITETLFAMGLGKRVAGVSTFCRYPAEAAALPKVGTFLNPSIEPILGLRPDLVIILKNPIQLGEKLAALNARVLEVQQESVAQIESSIGTIAEATGAREEGAALVQRIRTGLDGVRERVRARPRRSAVFLVGRTPGALEGMVAVGGNSYLNEIIELAGGTNVFADAAGGYPKISMEGILARDPDVIIDMGEMADTAGVTEAQKRGVVALWGKYPVLKAVREKRVYAVASDIFVVPGPRVTEAAREFVKMLHPEARE